MWGPPSAAAGEEGAQDTHPDGSVVAGAGAGTPNQD